MFSFDAHELVKRVFQHGNAANAIAIEAAAPAPAQAAQKMPRFGIELK